MGRKCCISRGEPDWTVEAYKLEESKEEVTVLSSEEAETQQGGSSRSESWQSSEFRRVASILNGPIWSRCSIAIANPARSHFQSTLSRGKRGQGRDERCRSSREEEWGDKDEQEKVEGKKTGDQWLFIGQIGEKTVCGRKVLGVTGTLGKANSHFDPTQTGPGAAPSR